VLAACDIELPGASNPLCSEGPTPWRQLPTPPHYAAVYEPIPRIISTGESEQTLVVFNFGGGWKSGTNGDDWFVGTAFLGRALASHHSSPCRVALLDYPKCALRPGTAAMFYTGLAAFALALAWLLSMMAGPLKMWLVLAALGYAVVCYLIWVREIKTSGRWGHTCPMCISTRGDVLPLFEQTTMEGNAGIKLVTADHQLEHVVAQTRALIDKYKPKHLVISGHSAGGQLAAQMGMMAPRLFPTVERVSVVGISGVYNVNKLWRHADQSWLGWFVTAWCVEPAFYSETGRETNEQVRVRLSPTSTLLAQSDQQVRMDASRQIRQFHLVSARHDNEMLLEQGDELHMALSDRGIDSHRHYGVGLGHGLGLAKSAKLVDLIAAVAARKTPAD